MKGLSDLILTLSRAPPQHALANFIVLEENCIGGPDGGCEGGLEGDSITNILE